MATQITTEGWSGTIRCPNCGLTVFHGLWLEEREDRLVVLCPRCGYGYDEDEWEGPPADLWEDEE